MARPRTPTTLKLIRGTLRPGRTNPLEPVRPKGAPKAPTYLSLRERAAWDRFASDLLKMRVLTPDYWAALEQLACAYAEGQQHRAALREHGWTYETVGESGNRMIRPRPEVVLLRAADRQVLNLLGRFGLTPADNSHVSAMPDSGNPDDEFRDDEFR